MFMYFIEILKSIILGIVEGITEWLPISSTGHLILVNDFMGITEESFFNSPLFIYVIQLGAILAVATLFFRKLNPFSPSKSAVERADTWQMWFKVCVACIPAAVVGLLLNDLIDSIPNSIMVIIVSAMLVLYGIAFIIIERFGKTCRCDSLNTLTYKTALFIGLFQVLAIIPGTSRSGATILGAMLLGCSREIAAEFSFFLAIPVMFGMSFLKIVTNSAPVNASSLLLLAISMVTAYTVSCLTIKGLMNYVKKHNFTSFGIYRIILGIAVIIYTLVKM